MLFGISSFSKLKAISCNNPIIVITEQGLNEMQRCQTNIKGYNNITHFTRSIIKWGGVVIIA